MKRLFLALALIIGASCLSLYAQDKKDKEEKGDEKAMIIKKIVENKRYIIYCDQMYPSHGPSRYVGREYTMEMKGDKFRSYLPYMGVARHAGYDGLNILDFEEEYTGYTCKEGKKGRVNVSFRVENGHETLDYTITIYPNGKVRVNILPLRRDPVSFSGEMALNQKLQY